MDICHHRPGALHGQPRQPRRDDGAAGHPARPRRIARRSRVDGERLHPDLCRTPPAGRRPRRPLRPAARVHDRPGHLHARIRGCGPGAHQHDAHPRKGRAGSRWGVRDAAQPDDPLRGHLHRTPATRLRPLGRDLRPRHRDRPRRRRGHHPGHLVALDLLDQRADRNRGRGPFHAPSPREPRARPLARSPRRRPRCGRSHRDRLGGDPRQRARLDRSPGPGLDRRGDSTHRRIHRLGSARGPAHTASAAAAPASVARRERHLVPHGLRDVRLDLPALAVLPGRAGAEPVRGGAARPAVDADAGLRRPDRRRGIHSHRRATDPRRRACAHGRRARAGSRQSVR